MSFVLILLRNVITTFDTDVSNDREEQKNPHQWEENGAEQNCSVIAIVLVIGIVVVPRMNGRR